MLMMMRALAMVGVRVGVQFGCVGGWGGGVGLVVGGAAPPRGSPAVTGLAGLLRLGVWAG